MGRNYKRIGILANLTQNAVRLHTEMLAVREIQQEDIDPLLDYWMSADPAYLRNMGADPAKLPARELFRALLSEQLTQSYPQKQSYCMIWLQNNIPVGHSNVNKIIYGQEAYMHLHLWKNEDRYKGLGALFVQLCLPYFFENLHLKKLFCEPYALNPAPNRILEKVGFTFVKEYTTTPGWINFEQLVKQWEMDYEIFKQKQPV